MGFFLESSFGFRLNCIYLIRAVVLRRSFREKHPTEIKRLSVFCFYDIIVERNVCQVGIEGIGKKKRRRDVKRTFRQRSRRIDGRGEIRTQRNRGGEYENVSVLVAIGVNEEGYREVIGAAEGMKEVAEGWRNFLKVLSVSIFRKMLDITFLSTCDSPFCLKKTLAERVNTLK